MDCGWKLLSTRTRGKPLLQAQDVIHYVFGIAIGIFAPLVLSDAGAPTVPPCIRHWPEVRYRNLGYDHIVHLRNECRGRARCAVSTDVNPEPVESNLAAGEAVAVLTMRGSPAREFTPRVQCHLIP